MFYQTEKALKSVKMGIIRISLLGVNKPMLINGNEYSCVKTVVSIKY